LPLLLLFSSFCVPRYLHSFPTRRSSDLGWIEFTGAGLRFQYHSRPCLKRYTEAQQADLAKVWETLPAASQCWVPLEIRADAAAPDRKSTRLNSSHEWSSYAVFCLKKKNT